MHVYNYWSYHDGCYYTFEMPDSEYQRLKNKYEDTDCIKKSFDTVDAFITAVLSFNC